MIVNLTPHAVNIGVDTYSPSGRIARVNQVTTPAGSFEGVALISAQYGETYVTDADGCRSPLPTAAADQCTVYIVSSMVRMANPSRIDLASPAKLIRDDKGRIVGCNALEVNRV